MQQLLAALLDLGLTVRHARWNCYGAGFRDLHLHLQEIADVVGARADAIAEHAVARGVSPDGRAASVADGSPLAPLALGPILVDVAIAEVAAMIGRVIDLCRHHLTAAAGRDFVGADLVVATMAGLEHHRWMLLAEFSAEPPAKPPIDAT